VAQARAFHRFQLNCLKSLSLLREPKKAFSVFFALKRSWDKLHLCHFVKPFRKRWRLEVFEEGVHGNLPHPFGKVSAVSVRASLVVQMETELFSRIEYEASDLNVCCLGI